jgi:iron complex outermembrane receptor protein
MPKGKAEFLLRSVMLAGSALLSAQAAHAQDAPASSPAERGLSDIVVTAERRATNLQDTPLSIVALTSEALDAKGVDDLQDLSKFTPNLNIAPSRGTGELSPIFQIRGIGGGGGGTGGAFGERGVGLYIDGIFVPRVNGSLLRVVDIDRVEVLRGPQGTLFGRNSTGGAVRIFTKQPSDEFAGYIRATGGNFERLDFTGMLNVPLSDTFSVRAQVARLSEDGFVKRGTQMLGGYEDTIGRVVAKFEPSTNFKFTAGFLYSHTQSDGTPQVMTEFDMLPGIEGVLQGNYADWVNDSFKAAGQAPLAPYNDSRIVRGNFQAPEICLLDDFNPDWDTKCEQFNDNIYRQLDFTAEWNLSESVKLTTVNGLAKLAHKGVSDWQYLGMEFRSDVQKSKVFYHETQLNAALFGGGLDLVTGFNYFHDDVEQPYFALNRRGTSAYPASANGNADAGLFRVGDNITSQTSKSYGIFASGTWHMTDRLNFTGGVRYAYDEKEYAQTRFAQSDFIALPGTTSTSVSTGDDWSQTDWRATVDYHFTDDIMAYATASKAYKAGQFSYTVIANLAGSAQSGDFIKAIPPEQLKNYEIGARTTLFERLRLNPTLFSMKYTNRQAARQINCAAEGLAACPQGFRILVVNSGDVDLYGAELEAQLAITDNFILEASGAITNYDLKDSVANGGPNLYPDVPSPTYTLGATYNADLGFGKGTFNLNYAQVGKQATHPTATGDSAYELPAYGIANARIQIAPNNAPFTVSLFANNLFDKTYAVYGQRFGGGFWDSGAGTGVAAPPRSALALTRGRPREIGATIQYDF